MSPEQERIECNTTSSASEQVQDIQLMAAFSSIVNYLSSAIVFPNSSNVSGMLKSDHLSNSYLYKYKNEV